VARDRSTSDRSTRDRLLDAAQRLAIEHGFGSTTIDAVLAEAGASKGSFFHYFPSKAELGRALVERYAAADAALLEEMMAAAEASSDDPAHQLVAFIAGFERATEDMVAVASGCLFVSFIYEAGVAGPATDKLVTETILLWRERILRKLEAAVASRPSTPPVDLTSLADQATVIFEGGYLVGRAVGDLGVLRRQLAHLRHYLALLFGVPAEADGDVGRGSRDVVGPPPSESHGGPAGREAG
jgi:TetR/AcrR family transcriptional repressor of nem operon